MAGMGPVPKKGARRRNVRPDWVKLPVAGHAGDVPDWPLSGDLPSAWSDLWALPQATQWATVVHVVARYCLLLGAIEYVDVPTAVLSEIRQLEDRLGLSPMSMRRLQWEISVDAEEPAVTKEAADVTQLDDYRELYEA